MEGQDVLDLRHYLRVVLRRWWVFVVLVVAGALTAFGVSKASTPIYETSARVLVQGGQTPGIPTLGDIQASQQLAQIYADLVRTRPVMEEVLRRTGLPFSVEELSRRVRVNTVRSIITIRARDPDPQQAARLANAVAQAFIDYVRDRQFTQLAQFQASLSQYGIQNDPTIIAAQAATMTTLSVAETAVPPTAPASPRTGLNMFLGALIGLFLAGGLVFLAEYLDNSIRSPEELQALTGLLTLGTVLRYPHQDGGMPTLIREDLRSSLAESYKFLRINLEFATLDREVKTILVTSTSPEEGKTTTAVNLAISMAREGKRVVLVDTDLRRPALHRVFGLRRQEQKGLTHLLLGSASLEEVLAPTPVGGLVVLPSGPLPPDPAHTLKTPQMRQAVEALRSRADLVVFDSPPLMAVTDPLVLAPLMDAVLLVVDARGTSRGAVRRGVEMLRQANPPFIGAVLNKVTPTGRSGYYYYYYYYYSEDGTRRRRRRRAHRRGLLGRLQRGLSRLREAVDYYAGRFLPR